MGLFGFIKSAVSSVVSIVFGTSPTDEQPSSDPDRPRDPTSDVAARPDIDLTAFPTIRPGIPLTFKFEDSTQYQVKGNLIAKTDLVSSILSIDPPI
jgi:hypothetical protein